MPGREEILKNKGFTTKILHSDRLLEQTHGELVQPVTDQAIGEIEELLQAKEKELMEI